MDRPPTAAGAFDISQPWLEQLTSNSLFTGGIGLAALGTAVAVGRTSVLHGARFLRQRLLTNVEITKRDAVYPWVLHYMALHCQSQLNKSATQKAVTGSLISRLLSRLTPSIRQLEYQTTKIENPDGSVVNGHVYVPGIGQHVLRYKNGFIWVRRERQTQQLLSAEGPYEMMRLRTISAHKHLLNDFLDEASELANTAKEGSTLTYTPWGNDWKPFGKPLRKRPIESVVLDEGLKERIIHDIGAFVESKSWYMERGVPYRRGYLLRGPTGTGKTSLIQALAGELDYDIASLNVSERGLTDDRLSNLLFNLPPRSILLLEDADAAFVNRQSMGADGYSGPTVTFAGLLNALDGVRSADERILFLTTNRPMEFDPALIRPGRIDVVYEIENCTLHQIGGMFTRFYAEFDLDGLWKEQFLRHAHSLGLVDSVSPAALQGLFLCHKDDPKGAVEHIHDLVDNGHSKLHGERLRASAT